jgi:ABC-type sulfate transport system permease component
VAGTSVNTAPVYIVELINQEQFYMAALACIVLIVVSFAFMMALRVITRKRRAG